MKIICSKLLPFLPYRAMTLWPFCFVRKEYAPVPETCIRHESIHARQQKEMLVVFFYVWYALEYLIRLFQFGSHSMAYKNISFEAEAYDNQTNPRYLVERKPWSWVKYL